MQWEFIAAREGHVPFKLITSLIAVSGRGDLVRDNQGRKTSSGNYSDQRNL